MALRQLPNERNIEQQRAYALLRALCLICLSVHLVLLGLFAYLGLRVLWIFNIFSCALFIFNLAILRTRRNHLILQLSVSELVVHSILAALLLGFESYFGLYLITTTVVIINSHSMSMRLKAVQVSLYAALFIALYILARDGFRVYTINPAILDGIGIANIVLVTVTLIVMSFQNHIENESLRKVLEGMTEVDALTGAYNRRFFNKYLDIEVRRIVSHQKYSLRKTSNLGIAMVDIDHFKRFNDTYGHQTGDRILVEDVQLIRNALFDRDVLCRYGGEEFAILFTATSRDGAVVAIEKIRRLVADHQFYLNDDNPEGRITISIGFASSDEETDVHKLLALADTRLYKAKDTGRNLAISE
jgi:diguanylate cyclase (GGDEF)-like protein